MLFQVPLTSSIHSYFYQSFLHIADDRAQPTTVDRRRGEALTGTETREKFISERENIVELSANDMLALERYERK